MPATEREGEVKEQPTSATPPSRWGGSARTGPSERCPSSQRPFAQRCVVCPANVSTCSSRFLYRVVKAPWPSSRRLFIRCQRWQPRGGFPLLARVARDVSLATAPPCSKVSAGGTQLTGQPGIRECSMTGKMSSQRDRSSSVWVHAPRDSRSRILASCAFGAARLRSTREGKRLAASPTILSVNAASRSRFVSELQASKPARR